MGYFQTKIQLRHIGGMSTSCQVNVYLWPWVFNVRFPEAHGTLDFVSPEELNTEHTAFRLWRGRGRLLPESGFEPATSRSRA